MKVYVFGNQDVPGDNIAIKIAQDIQHSVKNVEFVFIRPNEDIPFQNKENAVLMDCVSGITSPQIITDLNALSLSPRNSTHDFDLGFQLKYLKKLGKLGGVKIIAIPVNKTPDYLLIHSIFKKLVEHDIQGS